MLTNETTFRVHGMDCADEANAIRDALLSLKGVSRVEPNILSAQVLVAHAPEVDRQELVRRLESTGVSVEDPQNAAKYASSARLRIILVAGSGALLLLGLGMDWLELKPPLLSMAVFFISMLAGGALIAPKALRAIRTFSIDMNVLMAIAVVGAVGIGEYVEGAAVVFLFALAELLESLSLEKARRSIQSLLKLVPESALVKRNVGYEEIPVGNVLVGEVFLVRSGSRIPLDGIVLSGNSSVNQAPMTGESLPVTKGVGDRVLAGTINEEGSLEIKVTEAYRDTKVSQIIRLIEDAQKQKAPTQRFVDTFAKYYTPSVLVMAVFVLLGPPLLMGGEWSIWIYRALVLLVIACPCALVIATPVSVVSGLTAMAKRGVLIKGGAALESLGKIDALAVDKTGTITEGRPRVLTTHCFNGYSLDKVLGIAASIDTHSTHPLARAVVAHAKERAALVPESSGYQATSGRGAEAVIEDHIYFVGNHRFAHDSATCAEELERRLEAIENDAQTAVVVGHRPHPGCTGEVMGILGLGDAVRSDSKEAIKKLHDIGVKSIIMLSGDNQKTVSAISKQVGIDEAYGDLLPDDKVMKVKALRARFAGVAMTGDGINDAPAMAAATLGIAMGATGTDTAIEASDVTLMHDHLVGIADAIGMGKRVLHTIWFNTAFALGTKIVFLMLSVMGKSSLWLAIAADTGATLLVIGNALRLLR